MESGEGDEGKRVGVWVMRESDVKKGRWFGAMRGGEKGGVKKGRWSLGEMGGRWMEGER